MKKERDRTDGSFHKTQYDRNSDLLRITVLQKLPDFQHVEDITSRSVQTKRCPYHTFKGKEKGNLIDFLINSFTTTILFLQLHSTNWESGPSARRMVTSTLKHQFLMGVVHILRKRSPGKHKLVNVYKRTLVQEKQTICVMTIRQSVLSIQNC